MKTLILYSNHKLTGPAEAVLLGMQSLLQKGEEVYFACSENTHKGDVNSIKEKALSMGIKPLDGLMLRKHLRSLSDNKNDAKTLRAFIRSKQIDFIHTNLENDHLIATQAIKTFLAPPKIIRFVFDADKVKMGLKGFVLKRKTDALVGFTEKSLRGNRDVFSVKRENSFLLVAPADIKRFDLNKYRDTERPSEFRDRFVVGISTRVQGRRGIPILFKAIKLLKGEIPEVLFAVMGRGTNLKKIMAKAAEYNISDSVISLGFKKEEEYVGYMRHFDVFVYNKWGSDGTVKAAREAMLLAKPLVAPDMGIFPVYIGNNDRGVLVDSNEGSYKEAIFRLYCKKRLYEKTSENALSFAKENFSPAKYADDIIKIHNKLSKRQ